MEKTLLLRADRCEVVTADWGHLTWYASGKLGNSEHMTLGICVIHPGKCNPRHSHSNCVEILRVMQGRIIHTVENGEAEMRAGDVITIPVDFPHQARNIGDTDAVLEVAFSTPDRQVKGE
jgi:quercetin dioxygenase-like cupin family protein